MGISNDGINLMLNVHFCKDGKSISDFKVDEFVNKTIKDYSKQFDVSKKIVSF